jgi:uncharacterized protein (DUF2141 family)
MTRSVPICVLATCALLGASAPDRVAAQDLGPAKQPLGPEIRFEVQVDGNEGQVACALFTKGQWLGETDKPVFAAIRNRRAVCVFRNVRPGVYAISAFHDENRNKELDTNFLGIPTEGWCTSRNAKGFLGPPKFDDAKFEYRGGRLTLKGAT